MAAPFPRFFLHPPLLVWSEAFLLLPPLSLLFFSFFLSFADQTPPPLFSRFFSFPFFPTSFSCSRTTDLPPVQQPDGGRHSVLFLPFLPHPCPSTYTYSLSPPHAPAPSTFLAAVPSTTTTTTRRDDATRVHGTRIMEVFSAKVKLSGAKA